MSSRQQRAALAGLFALGLAISLLMLARVQIAGDAISLLSRGWLLAAKGIWVPFGNPAASTAGGYVPGGLTSLLVGLPLELWMDPRAPVVLILVTHVVAYLMLDRVVADVLGLRGRLILAVVYWLNPWRAHQSAWLDNSNYVFVAGALHLWACHRQRDTPSFLHSALLVAGVGLTFQIHLDAMILMIGSAALWLRGLWRPHWGGVALGTVISFASLVPFFVEVVHEPRIFPGGDGNLGRNLVHVWPMFKGALYWFRYASLYGSQEMMRFDFTPAFGAGVDGFLTPAFEVLRRLLPLTALPAVAANFWLIRRRRAEPVSPRGAGLPQPTWLREYALWTFAACIASNALSPTGVMWWHNLVALHAAVLPLVLWADACLDMPRAAWLRRGLVGWGVLSLVLIVGMAFGSNQYRAGGRDSLAYVLKWDHEMIRDLGLTECCQISVDKKTGQWPRKNSYFYVKYVYHYRIPPRNPKRPPPEVRWE